MESVMASDTASVDMRIAFVSAMRRLATTISIVTTHDEGVRHGMAATAVSSLSADPPSLLVCVKQTASCHGPISRSRHFCVNLLSEQHEQLFADFVEREGSKRFDVGEWQDLWNGLPCLRGATASFLCTLDHQVDYATHTICIGRVEQIVTSATGRSLLYHDGKSGVFSPLSSPKAPSLKLGSIIYPVTDMHFAVAFYRDLLGLTVKFQDADRWVAFDCQGATLALERVPAAKMAPGPQVTLKVVGSLPALVERLRAAGVAVGPMVTGRHEHTAVLTDPDGNRITLYAPLAG
jgi:flavin reductase (DIM6/NTAB) family NADH-FMN oxidoreductase RutF/catechol 2,3-dioxygenase-like lactoylglutathione lyase family enzyme